MKDLWFSSRVRLLSTQTYMNQRVCGALVEFNTVHANLRIIELSCICSYVHDLGSLEAVINLTTTSMSSTIQLAWQPPFSLNLTTAEPNIVYCVDIFNITDGWTGRDHLINNCSVFETYYNFAVDNPDPNDLFQFNNSSCVT